MTHSATSVCTPNTQRSLKNKDRIIFLGDSITQSGVLPHGYITLLSMQLAKHCPELDISLIGTGINGHRVPHCQKRLDRDVLQKNPSIVVLYIGVNDVWHWQHDRGTTTTDFEAGLRDIVVRIQTTGARVIICTPSVIGEKVDATNRYDRMLDEYADISRIIAQQSGSQLLNLRQSFMAYLTKHNPHNLEEGILTSDGVHLNKHGNSFLSRLLLEALCPPLLD